MVLWTEKCSRLAQMGMTAPALPSALGSLSHQHVLLGACSVEAESCALESFI